VLACAVQGEYSAFMEKQMAAQWKPAPFNKFGLTKTRSQIVFG
jgi:hypothetical protein